MTIAFVYRNFPSLGGVERVIVILANEMVKQGSKVVIYSLEQGLNAYSLDSSIEIICLPQKKILESKENVNFLITHLCEYKIELLFNHDSVKDSIELCRRVKKKINIPVVTLHHGQIYLPWKSQWAILKDKYSLRVCLKKIFFPFFVLATKVRNNLHHRYNIKVCDVYVFLAECYKDQLGIDKKVMAIPNPLSSSFFFEDDCYQSKCNTVVMVGRISDFHKRIILALRIWKEIENCEQFDSWNFDIAGDGPDFYLIQDTMCALGLKRVRLLGQVNSFDVYKKAKILLLTSAFEGFPLVLNEAKQCACVPIAMDSFESVHELINNGEDGLIISNNDLNTFLEGLKYLMSHNDILREMSKKSVLNTRKYEVSRLCNIWMDLFKSIVNN